MIIPIGLSDSGTESILGVTGANEGDVPINATIEVTPNFEENGITCSGDQLTLLSPLTLTHRLMKLILYIMMVI